VADVKRCLGEVFDELLAHEGHASMSCSIRWLRKDLKEVLVAAGKEHRFVVRHPRRPSAPPRAGPPPGNGGMENG